MTPDEHQRERMRAWALFCASMMPRPAPHPERDADSMLAEFDKRFPAPSAAAPVEAAMPAEFAELVFLRQKARLWDAVKDGAVFLRKMPDGLFDAYYGTPGLVKCTREHATPEEAVEAAIAAGATK